MTAHNFKIDNFGVRLLEREILSEFRVRVV